METAPETVPPKRTEWGAVLLLILAVGGSAVGVVIYQHMQGRDKSADLNNGFDLSQTTEARRSAGATGSAATTNAPGQPSSIGMIKVGNFNPGNNPAQMNPIQAAALAFANVCRANEDRVRAMAEKYTRASPAVQAYGQEWMKDPELKKLNDDYMRHHDPAAFLQGLAASKHFPEMIRKYGVNPTFQQIAREAMSVAPPNARDIAMDYLTKDKVANTVVDNVMAALGVGGNMAGVTTSDNAPPQIDAQKFLNGVVGSHPELQKQLGKDSPMNDPAFQKKLKALDK